MPTVATSASGYKGKATHRSWPQLPGDLVRHIATFYLLDLSASGYCPKTWEARDHWYQRMVFTTLRDANELEKQMMEICPQWRQALEHHLFWQKATALIDPNDLFAHFVVVRHKSVPYNSSSTTLHSERFSPWAHFRNITNCSCLVCRINHPEGNAGLTMAKLQVYSPYILKTGLCRDHGRRIASYCGLCLREAPIYENVVPDMAAQVQAIIAVVENEDREAFPNVDATCRACRTEWLWKRVRDDPYDREAIGGQTMNSGDWEIRNTVESFLDIAEGTIKDVIMLAREKHWLRTNTRLADMLQQALAAFRYNRGRRYDNEDQEEDEEEDEELELMHMEENGVKHLALSDWARSRIMDGHWFSPADFWYNHALPGKPMQVRAVHPCPWSRDMSSSPTSTSLSEEEDAEDHPRMATIQGEIPPTFTLCEQALSAHQRQLRLLLIPAMRNLVRKIVIECLTPGLGGGSQDPAIRAARMSMEDVLSQLREDEGVWFDGFDWAERGMNDRREREKREKEANGDDSSTASSESRSSNQTSPVLSTSTLQTTPSPPPSATPDDIKEEVRERQRSSSQTLSKHGRTIPIAPVLDPPKLLTSIPYIPVTASHFPQYTLDALKTVWREACIPLFHCRCNICQRAMADANANGVSPQREQQVQARPITIVPLQYQKGRPSYALSPALPNIINSAKGTYQIDGDGEDDPDLIENRESESELEELDDEDDFISGSDEERWYTPQTATPQVAPVPTDGQAPISPPPILRARKRSGEEFDQGIENFREKTPNKDKGTPPKRPRIELYPPDAATDLHLNNELVDSTSLMIQDKPFLPRRLKKRSSEEVPERNQNETLVENKRIKMSPGRSVVSPPFTVADGLVESPPSSTNTDLSRSPSVSLSS